MSRKTPFFIGSCLIAASQLAQTAISNCRPNTPAIGTITDIQTVKNRKQYRVCFEIENKQFSGVTALYHHPDNFYKKGDMVRILYKINENGVSSILLDDVQFIHKTEFIDMLLYHTTIAGLMTVVAGIVIPIVNRKE